jgi:hypothetical protein
MKLILKESQLSLSEGSVVNILGLVGLTLEMFPKSISSLQIVLEAGKVPMLHLSSYVPDFEIQEDPVQAAYDAAIKAVAQTITRSVATAKEETRYDFWVLQQEQEYRAVHACRTYKRQWNTWLAQRQIRDMYYYPNMTWTFNFDRKW